MSKVWEVVSLDEGDTVSIRVPHYLLTFANIRCIQGGEDTVIVMVNKLSSKIHFAPRISCDYSAQT